ncbi:MAG: peptidase MA family metallohydrolase [Pirellulales bacterium]
MSGRNGQPISGRIGQRQLSGLSQFIARTAPAVLFACLLLAVAPVLAQSTALLSEGEELFKAGKYEECLETSLDAIEQGDDGVSWWDFALRSQLELGLYTDADELLDRALERHPESLVLHWIGRDVRRMHNRPDDAREMESEIEAMLRQSPWRYRDINSQLVMAELLLARGADPKLVLDRILRPLQKENDGVADIHLAIGRLALAKQDFAMAADAFQQAVRVDSSNPQAHFGLAQSFASSDEKQLRAALEAALKANPQFVPALLLATQQHIAAENYDEALEALKVVEQLNPHHPLMWTYRAVIAHLRNKADDERAAYEKACEPWSTNPEVDYVLGRELSRKYRFAEGAAHQRRALDKAPDYLPARLQLSQDLLRLGQEDEGWQLAESVYESDPYQVLAYNLTELRGRVARFNTRYGDGVMVRMDPRESRIFGAYAQHLLERARSELSAKYHVQLRQPVLVEIFPRQADFAIRTFGLPGGEGFLGVCFGNVITANSPSERPEEATNWQATLWHEFCHVVTLNKTNNKMPRWLSEGISVYEEREASGLWGQRLTPRTRQMMLGKDFVPVSKLSAAFLNPASPEHLQFAYYESSLVVQWLIETHGRQTLNKILDDLGLGLSIEEVLTRYVGASEYVDREFAEYARRTVEKYGAAADWTELPEETKDEAALRAFLVEHPKNFWALQRLAGILATGPREGIAPEPAPKPETERQAEAEQIWRQLVELCPEDSGATSARLELVRLHRRRQEMDQEQALLADIAAHNGDALDVRLRLLELARTPTAERPQGDTEAARRWAAEILQINPFISAAREVLADQYRDQQMPVELIQELLAQLELAPLDPAAIHLELAETWRPMDVKESKRHVLQALELAPRYRSALKLLLEIQSADPAASDPVDPTLPDESPGSGAGAPAATPPGSPPTLPETTAPQKAAPGQTSSENTATDTTETESSSTTPPTERP